MTRRIFRPKPKFVALIAATLTVAAIACGNFTGVPASLPTVTDSGVVYAINGAPPGAPSALHVFSGTLISADANFFFDVAFDIDGTGKVVVLPQRAVASGLATTHTVSLQTTTSAFDAIDRAPTSGYRADTATVVPTNTVVFVQSQDANACSVSLTGTTLYAKILIQGVDPLTRKIKLRYTVDPNCGFFSFASGLPKD
ncbi:MAG: hypothetical protein JWM41_2465 [Gemmatimonadetes bacterium]|nr:hypothetical protein [Gemmatimonadota bacterium]